MRAISLAALIALLAGAPIFAQAQVSSPVPSSPGQVDTSSHTTRSPGAPIDKGPFTPEANRAYQGGGVILQGAPGQPAPTPEPTPPGQIPRNSVNPQ
jgi:hypothetical protein